VYIFFVTVLFTATVIAIMLLGYYALARLYLAKKFDYFKEKLGLKPKPIYKPSREILARKKYSNSPSSERKEDDIKK